MRRLPFAYASLLLIPLAPTPGTAQGAAVTVTIASGPNAGVYSLKDPRACVIEPQKGTHPRTLKAAVSDAAKVANPKMLGSAVFEIPLATTGAASPLLDIDLICGEPDNVGADYYVTSISETSKTGRGTVTVKERGATASMLSGRDREGSEVPRYPGVCQGEFLASVIDAPVRPCCRLSNYRMKLTPSASGFRKPKAPGRRPARLRERASACSLCVTLVGTARWYGGWRQQ
jgi:hypothetical protein